MIVLLNGEFVSEERATVSVHDRGFLYGDGLFETMRVTGGRPFLWEAHMERLRKGAAFLNIRVPYDDGKLFELARELARQNNLPESLLRLTLSRGAGRRGYSPAGADTPTLVMTVHPAPEAAGGPAPRWRVITASPRLPAGETLAQYKTCNKLAQVLARAEADAAGADEALLLNTKGKVVEASSSNLFWVGDGIVHTPPLAAGILAGVTRLTVLEICRRMRQSARETDITPAGLRKVDGVFLSLSSWGIIEVAALDGRELRQSPLVARIREAYERRMRAHRGK